MLDKLFPKIKSNDSLFEKWYENTSDNDNFKEYMGFDEDESVEAFDHDFCDDDEYGRYNKDMKDKYPKVYNKKLGEYQDSLLKEKARDWFDDRLYEFEEDLNNIIELTDKGVICYRAICVPDKEEFIFKLAHGVYLENYSGVGIYWSWDADKAEAHWGDGSEHLVLKGIIPFSSIDQERTLMLNLDPAIGLEEAEIRVIEGSNVIITGIDDEIFDHQFIVKT